MVLNVTSSFLQSVGATMESNATYNETRSSNNSTQNEEDYAILIVLWSFSLLLCLLGMAGNGMVIWILCFHMKRTSFTTYILHLSVADFAFLTTLVPGCICALLKLYSYLTCCPVLILLLHKLGNFTFSTSQFVLTAISVDRCVCLFFPLWHKCHRPPYLSTTVCVAIWILNFLFSAVDFALYVSEKYKELWRYQLLLNAVLCMPLMVISAIAMLIKVCFMSPHHKRGTFVRVVLLALLFFLFFAFPGNVSHRLLAHVSVCSYVWIYSALAAIINSAINPVIYFLVGRDKKAQSRRRIKKILEQLFQEEEQASSREETCESSLETHGQSH